MAMCSANLQLWIADDSLGTYGHVASWHRVYTSDDEVSPSAALAMLYIINPTASCHSAHVRKGLQLSRC